MAQPKEAPRGEIPVYRRTLHTLIDSKDLNVLQEAAAEIGVRLDSVATQGQEYTIPQSKLERLNSKPKSEEELIFGQEKPAGPFVVPYGKTWVSLERSNVTIAGTSFAPFWEEVDILKKNSKTA